jgi:predicted small metal-binding protein
VVRAETEEEALAQVAAHAEAVHNLEMVTEEVVEKVRQVMRDEQTQQRIMAVVRSSLLLLRLPARL